MRTTLLLFCCIACFSAANAQEGRYFEVIGLENGFNSLAAAPTVAYNKEYWPSCDRNFEWVDEVAYWEDEIWAEGISLPVISPRIPLPPGHLRPYTAAVLVEIGEECIASTLIINEKGEVMKVPLAAQLLAPGSHSWTLDVALPAGAWRFQVVAAGEILQEGALKAL
jgi:hypothetical protein